MEFSVLSESTTRIFYFRNKFAVTVHYLSKRSRWTRSTFVRSTPKKNFKVSFFFKNGKQLCSHLGNVNFWFCSRLSQDSVLPPIDLGMWPSILSFNLASKSNLSTARGFFSFSFPEPTVMLLLSWRRRSRDPPSLKA